MEEPFPETVSTDNKQSCHQNKEDLNPSWDSRDSPKQALQDIDVKLGSSTSSLSMLLWK